MFRYMNTVIAICCFASLNTYSCSSKDNLVLKDIKVYEEKSNFDVTISSLEEGQHGQGFISTIDKSGFYLFTGKFSLRIGGPMEPSSIPLNLLFGDGAKHQLVGQIEFYGYIFESHGEDPLRFVCVYGEGYKYVGGKGKVTIKETGELIELKGK